MQQIGRYRIQRELGRGAMGVVYLALDPAIGRTVAIKTIRLSELADALERSKLHDRLFREAQSAGILSHPGIVTIYDIAEEGDLAYIAMECVDGPTLDKLLATNPPDGKLVLSILSQTAAALDYAHKRGIVHRDIKPANIIVHGRETAKVTDFGVAKVQSQQMTHAGLMVGTPNYMSPEQIRGREVDGRADQFSLAVIAYELLTGEKPFTAESIPTLAFKIVNEQPEPVHRLNPTLGWTVDTVIRKALSKNPADRYPTCSDFAFALENACRSCKDWRPAPPGAAHDAVTLVGERASAPVRAATPPRPERARAPVARPPEPPERRRPPVALRLARLMALIVLGAALVSGLFVAGIQYFGPKSDLSAAVEEEPPARIQKPSPAPQPPPVETPAPASETPAESAPPEQAAAEPGEDATPAQPDESQQIRSNQPVETRLVTNPPGAYVVVDGRSDQSCTSPCTLTLGPGRHTLAATKEGFRRTLKIFEVPRDMENFLNLEKTSGTVMVRSEPQGASIFINGQPRNEKTPAIITLPTGNYTVELVRNGHRERQEVVVRDSAITNLAINFEGR
jgi:serine/threonine-protein kinase